MDMIFDLMANAHRAELAAASPRLDQRRQWAELRAVARLERALVDARGRLAVATTKFSRAG